MNSSLKSARTTFLPLSQFEAKEELQASLTAQKNTECGERNVRPIAEASLAPPRPNRISWAEPRSVSAKIRHRPWHQLF